MGAGDDPLQRIARLPCWRGKVEPEPLAGGITNRNFLVRDQGERFVVRLGEDVLVHGIMRFNELNASRAAFAAGISPEVVYAQAGALVLRFVDGATFTPADVRKSANLARIVSLVKRCHVEVPRHLDAPVLMFWPFQILRGYARELAARSSQHLSILPSLMRKAESLERAVGPIDIVFGHNDLLAANFIDDGERLWLIDWDYAGFNSPLFDLGGLASNNEFSDEETRRMLEMYFGHVDAVLTRRFEAMKCASLLRETMWSMVSEIHSKISFDYAAYTRDNLARFEQNYEAFTEACAHH
jgi:thiamine kinase-like enzyme